MIWIIGTTFTVIIISISVSLMCMLRIRFYDFYAEYGCFLWVIFTTQALSIIIKTTFEGLLFYSDVMINFINELLSSNDVLFSILYVISNIVTTMIPMFTQLSCFIFGWIRHKREEK